MILALLTTARADCMMPQAFFSTAGTSPRQATVFFFMPPDTDGTPTFTVASADHTAVPFTAEPLGGRLGAWQLKIDAPAAGVLSLTAAFDEGTPTWVSAIPATVTVVADWAVPDARSLTGMAENRHFWSCSHQLSTELKVTGTAPVAWAVEWAPDATAWAAGQRQTAWLPGNPDGFFRYSRESAGEGAGRLELGHLSCLGDTFDWSGDGVVARVVAVDADGIYRPLLDAPTAIPAPGPAPY